MKRFFYIILIILIVLIIFAIIDYLRVTNFQKPIFCIGTKLMRDGGSGKYIGLGYSFCIDGNFLPGESPKGITKYDYYILGKRIKSVIRN